jgi:hypothetical protein
VGFIHCCKIPFLLRASGHRNAQILLSPCYLEALMDFEFQNKRNLLKDRIVLVLSGPMLFLQFSFASLVRSMH